LTVTGEGDATVVGDLTGHTDLGTPTACDLPEWIVDAVRDGSARTASDNVQKPQEAVADAPAVTPPAVTGFLTTEQVGAMIGVQGQRIRQLVRKLGVGRKVANVWLLGADDLNKILEDRTPKEPKNMAARKVASVVALEGLAHIASRIERVEKLRQEDRDDIWALRKKMAAYDDRLIEFERKLLECFEPKPRARR